MIDTVKENDTWEEEEDAHSLVTIDGPRYRYSKDIILQYEMSIIARPNSEFDIFRNSISKRIETTTKDILDRTEHQRTLTGNTYHGLNCDFGAFGVIGHFQKLFGYARTVLLIFVIASGDVDE